MRGRWLAGILVSCCALATAPALAEDDFPEFDIDTYSQSLGVQTEISFDVYLLQGSAAAATIAITEPAGYATNLATPIGRQIGTAAITAAPLAGGAPVDHPGTLVTTDPTSDTLASACAPGSHAATWHLALNSPLDAVVVPIVVDRQANGSYRMTACLDSVRAAGLKPTDVYFNVRGVFGNPRAKGVYRWSALVTPTSAAGTPDAGTAFEMRADEPLPEILDAHLAYARGTLTVKGKLTAAGSPRAGIRVHIYAGASSDARTMKDIGVAVTSRSGSYVFTKRTAKPRYVMAYVSVYRGPGCDQPSTAPAGCASESIDGAGSGSIRTG